MTRIKLKELDSATQQKQQTHSFTTAAVEKVKYLPPVADEAGGKEV